MYFRLEGLNRRFGAFELKDINLVLKQGEYFVLLGPCGSGKTLLLNTISGIYRPDAGKIHLGDKEITFLPAERRGIGYLFQNSCIFPHLSVRANIDYGLNPRNRDRNRLDLIMRMLGISSALLDRKDSHNLSGGEARKVALARTLAVNPSVLLLDEPLSFLDPASRRMVKDILLKLKHELDITIVHVTHDLEEAEELADNAAVIIDGSIEATGSPAELSGSDNSLLRKRYWGEDV